jgi:CO/xanthine dehydrogenase FAD-binding subunit
MWTKRGSERRRFGWRVLAAARVSMLSEPRMPAAGLAGEVRASDFSVLAPIDDVRGTAAYRLDAAQRLTQRALRELGEE